MPNPKRVHATLTINYDQAKDLIFISADHAAGPGLADGGLYITLKRGSASETLLRRHLMAAGVIPKAPRTGLDIETLLTGGRLEAKDAKLLHLLARDNRGVAISGSPEGTLWAAATYLSAGRSPRVVSIDTERNVTDGTLDSWIDDAVLLNLVGHSADGRVVTSGADAVLAEAYRMRAEFIVVNLHAGHVAADSITPKGKRGVIYRLDALGKPTLGSLIERDALIDAHIRVEEVEAGDWRIAGVDLLG